MSVRVEKSGRVTTVILSRIKRRNAVDRETADALTAAFEAFDHDEDSYVAVLWGEGGTFCAGADLRAIAEGRPNRVEPGGPGPMGPTRMVLTKPVVAAVAGHAVAGGPRTRALVRPARRRGRRHIRGVLPSLGRSAHRWWHRAPAPHRRDLASARHDPHRARRRGKGSARVGPGQPGCAERVRAGRRWRRANLFRSNGANCTRLAHTSTRAPANSARSPGSRSTWGPES